jgi:hypothetical protein
LKFGEVREHLYAVVGGINAEIDLTNDTIRIDEKSVARGKPGHAEIYKRTIAPG